MAFEPKVDPKKMVPALAWSPSTLQLYEKCPRRYQYEKAQKLCTACFGGRMYRPKGSPDGAPMKCAVCQKAEVIGEPLVYGTRVGKELEDYVKGVGKMTPDIKPVSGWLAKLRDGYKKKKVRVEMELAFRRDWTLTEWFAKDTYARFKLDVFWLISAARAKVIDWKTGKNHGEYADQLDSYATGSLAAGLCKEAETSLVFTKTNEEVKSLVDPNDPESAVKVYTLADLKKLQKKWDGRAKKMLADKNFIPKPNGCKFCPFTANRGGPCRY